ncbi:hypothetical protein [Methyloterricola oryzae]|uniref:hypothetical protein n=1 Tax=Methyloterricola oryzae TaxID=1495050 RepID=UPI0005EBDC42|nr:hypothetical protein [Methyloterricola oryzae]
MQSPRPLVYTLPCRFLIGALVLVLALADAAEPAGSRQDALLDPDSPDYRTPRAGEGFRTSVFGEEITVPERDLRHINAWKLGVQIETPQPDDRLALPAGALYFWRQPDSQHLYRAEITGVYNNVFWGVKPEDWGNFEAGLTFNSFTLPSAWNEVYDGIKDSQQEIYWGYVRPGLSLGLREQLDEEHPDNMWQLSYILEPGYFYSGRSGSTSPDMVLPKSTFELRNRLSFRYDAIERNILSLPHAGSAFGADFVYGYRANWADWGTPGLSFNGGEGQNYVNFNAYWVGAGGVPFVDSDRHRLVSWVHAGVGHNLDRFSATRVGGGPSAMGMEFGSSAMPVLPGTSIWEFYPEHYAIGALEYRYELTWFSYLTAHGGVGYLDPYRPSSTGTLARSEELLPWMGARLSTGFLGDSMLMLDYAHSFNLVNEGTRGGNEIMLWLSGEF